MVKEKEYIQKMKMKLKKELISTLLFEFNSTETREKVITAVNSFLINMVENNELKDFASICDETNNSKEMIERGDLLVGVTLRPTEEEESFFYVPLLFESKKIKEDLNILYK